MADVIAPLDPVPGDVIKRSLLKNVGSILFLILIFVFGLFLIWAWWTGATLERFGTPHKVTWWGLLIGIAAVLFSPILVAALIHHLLARERLVIGGDRLQIIRCLRGREVVCLQIPFANIAKCSYEVTNTDRRIGIDLADLDDPATYAKGENLKLNKELKGWHYVLEGGYRKGVAAIHKKLEEKMGQRSSEGAT